jgi:hypothetical protein
MPHYRSLMDPREYFGRPKIASYNQEDAHGKHSDVTYRILKCEAGEVQDPAGRKTRKPVLLLQDRSRKEWSFPVGATICKTLEKLYGPNTDDWSGKLVTLFVTTTHCPEGEVYCLRVRPTIPESSKGAAKSEQRPNDRTEPPAEQPTAPAEPEPPRMREPGEDG